MSSTGKDYFWYIIGIILLVILITTQVGLILLKVFGGITISWGWVFAPLLVSWALAMIVLVLKELFNLWRK